jgi:uncharacterized protein (DUF1778 family)
MRKGKGKKPSALKANKVQLRLRPDQKALLVRAARVRQTTLSNFVLENACQAAEQVLADQVHFVLSPAQWEQFCAALDAPPRELPALRKLLTEPSVFDGPGTDAPQ